MSLIDSFFGDQKVLLYDLSGTFCALPHPFVIPAIDKDIFIFRFKADWCCPRFSVAHDRMNIAPPEYP